MGAVVDVVKDAAGAVSDAIGTVVESAAEGIASLPGATIEGLAGLGSAFVDVLEVDTLESIGGAFADLAKGLGGAIADAADFIYPEQFFNELGENFKTLGSMIMDSPLGDIGKAIADPFINVGKAIADFFDSLFSGELTKILENTITDYPSPAQREMQETINATADSMNGVFESLKDLNPGSSDFPEQLGRFQQAVNQVRSTETIIGKMLETAEEVARKMNPLR